MCGPGVDPMLHLAAACVLGVSACEQPPARTSLWDWLPKIPVDAMRLAVRRDGAYSESTAFVKEVTRSSEDWTLRVEREGVRVWRRSVPGTAHAEVRGNGLINASPRQGVHCSTSPAPRPCTVSARAP